MSRGNHLNSSKIINSLNQAIQWMLRSGLFIISLLAFVSIIVEAGFKLPFHFIIIIHIWYFLCVTVFLFVIILRMIMKLLGRAEKRRILYSEYFLFIVVAVLLLMNILIPSGQVSEVTFVNIVTDVVFLRFSVSLLFIIELSKKSLKFQRLDLNPALLFIGSFLLLILAGTALLMLPRATTEHLSILEALFTSTSAVCVTGLIVVDTATRFTHFGQLIILILIQLGGLGIMTFTTFFGFFFKGASSYQNTLFIKEFINESKLSEILHTIVKVVVVTLIIEAVGAGFIYYSVAETFDTPEAVWYAVFHSISAFCNAGFSTLSNGLYEPVVRFQYGMQMIIAALIFFGSIGFPVIFDIYKSLKYYVVNKYMYIFKKKPYAHRGRHLTVHTKMVLVTTAVLLTVGFIVYYIAEYNNTLAQMPWYGKIVAAVFGAVTPRTAGFNTVDMASLSAVVVLIYLFLMWIGASPGSTGGGLKTTTFAVAILNVLSISKQKDRIEVFRREITNESVRKAFSVVLLSLLVIGTSIVLVALFDPDIPLLSVIFECFSAFSTVGLSLGITGDLSEAGKVVIIITMFLGRVGTLTLLAALIASAKTQSYRYPSESVFIS
ncbi:ATPase [Fulvivirga ulvae]|uniref:TrkH family potassium uptake protein n=1 Tax=Fulvivirga ulvae TaxID=2904245 RepID=UPI001F1E095C|nr:potassium transporter TrkG [Fulvivirga ulvae]UII33363.1 ATPase [Fulvivirga ulvae]